MKILSLIKTLYSSQASIKNNIAFLISHICRGQEIIAKSIHYAMNMTSTEAELFAIRCSINYAVQLQNIHWIVVITDDIQAVKQIFDLSIYLYQLHFITISRDFKEFFAMNSNNSIDFWDYLDSIKWSPYLLVNKESKCLKINPVFLSKSSWEFSRKEDCNSIICK